MLSHKLQSLRLLLRGCSTTTQAVMWIVTDFMRQTGNVQHFSSKKDYINYISWSRELKEMKVEMIFPVLRMILTSADRDASALLSLAASQNGPFLYIQTSWSLISCNWLHPLRCRSSVQTERDRIVPLFVFFLFRARGRVRVGGFFSPRLSLFSCSLHRLSSHLFGFSYAMARGMITSWQGTSHQLEARYLWQLLSNCCSWTVTPPPSLPSAPH